MHRLFWLSCGFAILAFSNDTPAQNRTDFSGRWTNEPEAATEAPRGQGQRRGGQRGRGQRGRGRRNAVGNMGSGWGSNLTIEQDEEHLTVEYAFFRRSDLQPPLKFVFALDGSETENSVAMGRGFQVQRSRTRWEDEALLITTVHSFEHPVTREVIPYEVRTRLFLESPIAMVVEVHRAGLLGGPPSTTRTTYRRVE